MIKFYYQASKQRLIFITGLIHKKKEVCDGNGFSIDRRDR